MKKLFIIFMLFSTFSVMYAINYNYTLVPKEIKNFTSKDSFYIETKSNIHSSYKEDESKDWNF